MNLGKELNVDIVLRECEYTKVDDPNFRDKEDQAGVAIGGRFASLEELKSECEHFDVYIYSLHEIENEKEDPSYWALYGCRERSVSKKAKAKAMAPFRSVIR